MRNRVRCGAIKRLRYSRGLVNFCKFTRIEIIMRSNMFLRLFIVPVDLNLNGSPFIQFRTIASIVIPKLISLENLSCRLIISISLIRVSSFLLFITRLILVTTHIPIRLQRFHPIRQKIRLRFIQLSTLLNIGRFTHASVA
jgi:hypothetical protein